MKKEEIKEIKDKIEGLIDSLPKKEVIPFIDMLKITYGKDYDDGIVSDRIKEIGKEISKIYNGTVNCIPVGYYDWYGTTISFNVGYKDSISCFRDEWLDNDNLVCPEFNDDMTKGEWKKVLKLIEELIEESLLKDGENGDNDNVSVGYTSVMYYDIENETFEVVGDF